MPDSLTGCWNYRATKVHELPASCQQLGRHSLEKVIAPVVILSAVTEGSEVEGSLYPQLSPILLDRPALKLTCDSTHTEDSI